jgi:hypothetical protein
VIYRVNLPDFCTAPLLGDVAVAQNDGRRRKKLHARGFENLGDKSSPRFTLTRHERFSTLSRLQL